MDLREIKGIGESAVKLLAKLDIRSASDLVENVPRDYDDYSKVQAVRDIRPGIVTVKAKISSLKPKYSKKGLHMTEGLVMDETGGVRVVWFNQPYRAKSIKPDEEYYLSGEFANNYKYLVLNNPVIEPVSNFPVHTARLVPKYKLTKGLSAHQLRKYTKSAFDKASIPEILPSWLIEQKKLESRRDALFGMHFPDTLDALRIAKRRVAFDELFEMMLASQLNKKEFASESAANISFSKDAVKSFVSSLPYTLTNDQRKSAWSILQDMTQGYPMNRLLEGDVGSGKTVVAAIAIVNVDNAGLQSAFMAPTEILARQHATVLCDLLPEPLANSVVFLSGSMTKKQKDLALAKIASGEAKLVVGTHALIQSGVEFKSLGLVVIDEQHRFGVEQRKKLQSKAALVPHVLNMTATPIPRSLTLTLYGEMSVSVIAQKPPGRSPTDTKILMPEQRQQLYKQLVPDLEAGRQAFVVCPLIEEDPAVFKPSRSLSVNAIHKQLEKWLKGYSVGLLHGKMKGDEKEQVMQDFVDNKHQVLVSTTVVEVGVDVPNATTMIIEGADRFGLAQVHQLRGRVGRGEHAGKCYLVLTDNQNPSRRIRLLERETDGFKLAEYDLELRGPGAIYGTMQHGALDLRVAKITDTELITEARESAEEFMTRGENLLEYPQLKTRVEYLRKITNLN